VRPLSFPLARAPPALPVRSRRRNALRLLRPTGYGLHPTFGKVIASERKWIGHAAATA